MHFLVLDYCVVDMHHTFGRFVGDELFDLDHIDVMRCEVPNARVLHDTIVLYSHVLHLGS
jgi:hypothetical protein